MKRLFMSLFYSQWRNLVLVALTFNAISFNAFAQDTSKERIISAGSSVTEIMLALDVADQLIAVDATSDLPDNLSLPKVGYHRQLATEGLMSLNPTRIIGSNEMGPQLTLTQLKQAGIDVNVVNSESTIEGLLTRIEQIAQLTQADDKAQWLKKEVIAKQQKLQTNQPDKKLAKKVIFLLMRSGQAASVAGEGTPADAIIELAGAINPAHELITSYKPMSMEALVQMQPDAILVSSRTLAQFENIDALLETMPILRATPAGKNQQIIAIDGHALIGGLGLHSLDEAMRLNSLLYQSH